MGIDLIHAHFLNVNGFVEAALKHLYNKPLILTAHGGDVYNLPFRDTYYGTLTKYVLKEAFLFKKLCITLMERTE